MRPHRTTNAAVLALALTLIAGCAQPEREPPPAAPAEATHEGPSEAEQAPAAETSRAVTAVVPEVTVHDSPEGAVAHTFDQITPSGAPLTFMVLAEEDGWFEVQLPVRPNGSSGWVSPEEVTVHEVPYRLEVSTADNRMALYRNGLLMSTFAVATGTGDTPTPVGTYYLTELIAPTNPGYGPFAYGVSAFS
uniref:L,D-transpeptidase family protein n=1 Tax=Actinotalea sp. C106 TaxID=2908644 RepID=UPI00202941AC